MSNKKKPLKSKCCNADVRIEGMDDFDQTCTMYHECTKCGNPCDVIIKVRKLWAINPKTRIVPNKKKKNDKLFTDKELKKFREEEDF
jgi:hypothetical protein